MKTKQQYAIVLVTAPNIKTARRIARAVLAERLAACVNVVPQLESHYWWQGRIEQGAEVLLLIKTSARQLKGLEKSILSRHPYDTPEFIVMKVSGGNQRYLDWWERSLWPD